MRHTRQAMHGDAATGIEQPLLGLAVALALGFLVGFQREWAAKRVAGIRTFPLITVAGAFSAWLADGFGGWVFAAALLGLTALLWRQMEAAHGTTTEVAAILMFLVGGMVTRGEFTLSIACTGAAAVLLHWKAPLHGWVRHLQAADLSAVMRFVLIALVILPALPDRSFGPYQVVNPYRVWAMVVLIVGISLAAYVAHRLAGSQVGTVLAGFLGGLISSTATTVSYARQTRLDARQVAPAAMVLILASTVVFARVLFELGLVAPAAFGATAPPLVAMMVFMGLLAAGTYVITRERLAQTEMEHAPSDLRAAIGFGLLYAVVLVGVAAAKESWGAAGLYGAAVLSGLTDVDAITLSTAQLIDAGRLDPQVGWRVVLIGVLSNLVFKGLAACVLGARSLWPWVLVLFGLSIAAGLVLLGPWTRALAPYLQ